MPFEGALEPHTCWCDDHVGKLAPTEVGETNLEVCVRVPLEIDHISSWQAMSTSVFFSSGCGHLLPHDPQRRSLLRK